MKINKSNNTWLISSRAAARTNKRFSLNKTFCSSTIDLYVTLLFGPFPL